MERKTMRRVCRLLLGIAVAMRAIALADIAISFVALGNGNIYASIPLIVGIAIVLFFNGLTEAIERRMV